MNIPYYVLVAAVEGDARVRRFHAEGEDSASALLGNPQRFRRGGFDVAIPQWPEHRGDELIAEWHDRKSLRLRQDGTLAIKVRADAEFLGWGVPPERFQAQPRLNPVTVVELNASFVHLFGRVLRQLRGGGPAVRFELVLSDATWDGGSARLYLTEYSDRRIDWNSLQKYPLEQPDGRTAIDSSIDEVLDAPNRVAFKITYAFFEMFDAGDIIPFVSEGKSGPEVDLEAIKGL